MKPDVDLAGLEALKGQPLILRSGAVVTLNDLADAFGQNAEREAMLAGLVLLVKEGLGEEVQLFVAALTIAQTQSAFKEGSDTSILERVAEEYPLSRWLREMNVPFSQAGRGHIAAWWDSYMFMTSQLGYRRPGINSVSGTTNLWQATGTLAKKMQRNPPAYRFLPALLINHPQEVERVLREINDATAFLEVLTGEAYEDLERCPAFLGAFSTMANADGTMKRSTPEALFSVHLALKRP